VLPPHSHNTTPSPGLLLHLHEAYEFFLAHFIANVEDEQRVNRLFSRLISTGGLLWCGVCDGGWH